MLRRNSLPKTIRSTSASSNGSLVKLEPDTQETPEFQSDLDAELNSKVSAGLLKIKQYDKLIQTKLQTARTLKKERLERDSRSATPDSIITDPSYHTTLSDEEDDLEMKSLDEDDLELKSLKSEEIKTFITEPKFHRVAIGRQALEKAQKITNQTLKKKQSKEPQVGYKVGDFIQRNIVLGNDARYYHALTQEEKDRVQNILDLEAFDVDLELNNEMAPFTPKQPEMKSLERIDSQLCLMTPQEEWDQKSLIWSSQVSGIQTPNSMSGLVWGRSNSMLDLKSFNSSSSNLSTTSRDLDSVMNDTHIMDTLPSASSKLNQIDLKIEQLHKMDDEGVLVDIETLSQLIQQVKQEQAHYPAGPSIQ